MNHPPKKSNQSLTLLTFLAACASGLLMACHDGSSNRPASPPVLKSEPATASLAQGQSLQFTATSSWGLAPTWSLSPANGGTISANGLFTATGPAGVVTVIATWKDLAPFFAKSGQNFASAVVTILPPPSPAVTNPNLVQASGQHQQSADSKVQNSSVAGGSTPGGTSSSPDASLQIRHGFTFPVTEIHK